ncbi:type IV secretory system conjugative DNA transfer family protein [Mycoplasma aquilae ATCC BAA-1896]|uniref:type IV secretory system conjugative DNA transfer family protein n=1 Tax=Mycoplasma aquilae TaxID=1312741 RepID=UPI003A852323
MENTKFDAKDYVNMNDKAINTLKGMKVCVNREFSLLFHKKMYFFVLMLMKHKEENNECISLKEMSEEYGISLNTLWGATKYLVANNLIIKKAKKEFKVNDEIQYAKYGEKYISIDNDVKWNLLFAGNFITLWISQKMLVKVRSKKDLENVDLPNKAFRFLGISRVTIYKQLKLISEVLLNCDFNDVFCTEKNSYKLDKPVFETYTKEELEEKMLNDEEFNIDKQLCKHCCDLEYSLHKTDGYNWTRFRKNGWCYFYIEYLASVKSKSNLVITDPKGEILASSGNILKNNGYKIVVFDLVDTRKSIKWNPLKLAWEQVHNKPKDEITQYEISRAYESISDVMNAVSKSISENKNENDIWERKGVDIVELVLKFMLLYSLEDDNFKLNDFSIANVMQFISENNFKKGKWVEKLKKYRYKNDEWKKLYASWEIYFNTNKDTLTSALFNASDLCAPFAASPEISSLTSNDTFDVKELLRGEQPFAIYIKYNDAKTKMRFLISLFVTQLYQNAIDITQETSKWRCTTRKH